MWRLPEMMFSKEFQCDFTLTTIKGDNSSSALVTDSTDSWNLTTKNQYYSTAGVNNK